jgi:hypothetical protein
MAEQHSFNKSISREDESPQTLMNLSKRLTCHERGGIIGVFLRLEETEDLVAGG